MLLKRLLGERVELDLSHGRDLWFVKADVNQFEQVVVNLAVNARDAMPDGGKLVIRTANVPAAEAARLNVSGMPPADYVMVEVSDTGTGMAPDVLEKIFEPFFTTKEVGKGTGLGLSTVFGIVKQSGGFIDVDSKVGHGTIFRIYLPRHIPEAHELPEEAKPETVKKPAADMTGQGTILLVEDEDPVRAVNARALSARGYTVLEAASGVEALQIIEERGAPVDLVVSDVVMPEMDGPTLLGELRKLYPDLKVIFVSGYAEDAFRSNLPEGEEFNFLPKPFSLRQLVETVKQAIGSKNAPLGAFLRLVLPRGAFMIDELEKLLVFSGTSPGRSDDEEVVVRHLETLLQDRHFDRGFRARTVRVVIENTRFLVVDQVVVPIERMIADPEERALEMTPGRPHSFFSERFEDRVVEIERVVLHVVVRDLVEVGLLAQLRVEDEHVVARIALQRVIARSAEDLVIAGAARENVFAAGALQDVVRGPSRNTLRRRRAVDLQRVTSDERKTK